MERLESPAVSLGDVHSDEVDRAGQGRGAGKDDVGANGGDHDTKRARAAWQEYAKGLEGEDPLVCEEEVIDETPLDPDAIKMEEPGGGGGGDEAPAEPAPAPVQSSGPEGATAPKENAAQGPVVGGLAPAPAIKAPAPATVQQVAPVAADAIPQVCGDGGPQVTAALSRLVAASEVQKTAIGAAGEAQKALVRQAGEAQKLAAQQAVVNLRTAVSGSYEKLRTDLRARGEKAKSTLFADRDAQMQRLDQDAATQIKRVEDGAVKRHDDMLLLGDELAGDAETSGATEAGRARQAGQEGSGTAYAMGEEKAAKFAGYDESAKCQKTARSMARKTGAEIAKSGEKVAVQCEKDGGALGDKMRKDAGKAAGDFEVDTDTIAQIREAVNEAKRKLETSLDDVFTDIDTSIGRACEDATTAEGQALEAVDGVEVGLAPSIDAAVETACLAVQRGVDESKAELDGAVTQVVDDFDGVEDSDEAIAAIAFAQSTVDSVGGDLVAGIADVGSGAVAEVEKSGGESVTAIDKRVEPIDGSNKEALDTFDGQMTEVETSTKGQLVETVDGFLKEVTALADDADAKLEEQFKESEKPLRQQLKDGKTELTGKVDKTVAKINEQLNKLPREIVSKADDIEHASWWDKLTSALGAFFTGFFKGFLEFLVWMVVILAVIALIVVLIVFFAPGLLAGLLVVLTWVGYIGIAAAVVFGLLAVYKLIKIWAMDNDLTWEEKWEQSGYATFEIVDALNVPGKVVKLTKLVGKGGKFLKGLGKADDVADAVNKLDPHRWNADDLTPDEAYDLYKANTKSPMARTKFDEQLTKGLRYDPASHRWKQVGGRLDEVAKAKEAAKGPSGKTWDASDMTKAEFIADYRARHPKTKLGDDALGSKFDDGMRLNPETGRLKKPKFQNDEIRRWYNAETSKVDGLDAEWRAAGMSAAERARKAYELRHAARIKARKMMQNPKQVRDLQARDMAKYGNPDGPTFDQLVKGAESKGMTGDARFEHIVGSSSRTDAGYNARHGIGGDGAGASSGGKTKDAVGKAGEFISHEAHEVVEGAEGVYKTKHAKHAVTHEFDHEEDHEEAVGHEDDDAAKDDPHVEPEGH